MKSKSPQEKKTLSYAKDCRNTYGENDKGSRESIRKRKAGVNRVYRRKINEVLDHIGSGVDIEAADAADAEAKNIRRPFWKKATDQPLGEIVERKIKRRVDHAGKGKTARKAIREFLSKVEIETEIETDGRCIAEAKGLDGVLVYGESEDDAIAKCRRLAGLVYMETIGAGEILTIDDNFISIVTY